MSLLLSIQRHLWRHVHCADIPGCGCAAQLWRGLQCPDRTNNKQNNSQDPQDYCYYLAAAGLTCVKVGDFNSSLLADRHQALHKIVVVIIPCIRMTRVIYTKCCAIYTRIVALQLGALHCWQHGLLDKRKETLDAAEGTEPILLDVSKDVEHFQSLQETLLVPPQTNHYLPGKTYTLANFIKVKAEMNCVLPFLPKKSTWASLNLTGSHWGINRKLQAQRNTNWFMFKYQGSQLSLFPIFPFIAKSKMTRTFSGLRVSNASVFARFWWIARKMCRVYSVRSAWANLNLCCRWLENYKSVGAEYRSARCSRWCGQYFTCLPSLSIVLPIVRLCQSACGTHSR